MTSPAAAGRVRTLSPRKRAQRIRWVQYAVLVAAVAVLIAVADLRQIQKVFFRGDLIVRHPDPGTRPRAPQHRHLHAGRLRLRPGARDVLALMRLSSVGPYRWIATVYIEFFRGLPAHRRASWRSGCSRSPSPACEIPFGIYGTVVDRARPRRRRPTWPRRSAPASRRCRRGRSRRPGRSACRAGAATRTIVLPQAFRIVIPPLTNELILLVKDSSLVYILGLSATSFELTKFGRDLANTERQPHPARRRGPLLPADHAAAHLRRTPHGSEVGEGTMTTSRPRRIRLAGRRRSRRSRSRTCTSPSATTRCSRASTPRRSQGEVVCVIGPVRLGQVDAAALRQPARDSRRGGTILVEGVEITDPDCRHRPGAHAGSAWSSSSSTSSRT